MTLQSESRIGVLLWQGLSAGKAPTAVLWVDGYIRNRLGKDEHVRGHYRNWPRSRVLLRHGLVLATLRN